MITAKEARENTVGNNGERPNKELECLVYVEEKIRAAMARGFREITEYGNHVSYFSLETYKAIEPDLRQAGFGFRVEDFYCDNGRINHRIWITW